MSGFKWWVVGWMAGIAFTTLLWVAVVPDAEQPVVVTPDFATERIDVTFEDTGRVFRCDAEAGVQIVLSRCEETP